MTDVPPPRPGSRSERHQKKRGRRRGRGEAPAAPVGPAAPAPPPLSTSTTILPGKAEPITVSRGRAARRDWAKDARRGRRRRIIRTVAVLLLLVLAVTGAVYLRANRADRATEAPQAPRTQRTVLMQVRGPTGAAAASALIATDPATSRAALLLLPSRVVAEVPGYGDSMLGKALELGGPQLAAESTANLLGVLVDGTWTLSVDGLAGLVDEAGGVTVDVDAAVPAASGAAAIPAGSQRLEGAAAARFATYQGPEEQELARLPRLQAVLTALLKTPPAAAALPGASSESSLEPAALAGQLSLLSQAQGAEALTQVVMPVTQIEYGGDEATYQVDTAQLDPLLADHLAGSVPANDFGGKNRVQLRNAAGSTAVVRSASRKLLPAGFRVVGTGEVPAGEQTESAVLIFDESDASLELGARVAEVLGLPETAVKVSNIEPTVADVIVVLGPDYKP